MTQDSSQQHKTPFVLTEQVRRQIAGAIAELDRDQLQLLRMKTPAERVEMALSMIDAAEQVGVYRLRQREPELSQAEAIRIVRGGVLKHARRKHTP